MYMHSLIIHMHFISWLIILRTGLTKEMYGGIKYSVSFFSTSFVWNSFRHSVPSILCNSWIWIISYSYITLFSIIFLWLIIYITMKYTLFYMYLDNFTYFQKFQYLACGKEHGITITTTIAIISVEVRPPWEASSPRSTFWYSYL